MLVPVVDLVDEVTSGDWGQALPDEGAEECVVVRATDFSSLALSSVDSAPHRFLRPSSLAKRQLLAGDLLVEMSGGSEAQPTGRLVRVGEEVASMTPPVVFSNFVKRLRLKQEVDSEYFALAWRSLYDQGRTRPYEKRTTGIRNFRLDDFLVSERLLLPSLEDQKRVAWVLATIEQATEATVSVASAATTLRNSIRHSLFDQRDWPTAALGDVAVIRSGGTPSRAEPSFWGGDIPWVKTGEIDYGIIHQAREHITPLGLENSSARIYPNGTILMAMYGDGVTRGKVATLGLDASINQACAAIVPNGDLTRDFLYQYLASAYEEIRSVGHGAHQKNLSGALLKRVLVPIPPLAEQEYVAEVLNVVDAKIEAERRSIDALRFLFDALLGALLNPAEDRS
jgi:type I restriction enzyme S subunit